MYAEAYLTDMLLSSGVVGLRKNQDGTLSLDFADDATNDQKASATQIATSFDYDTVESTLSSIYSLEGSITARIMQSAIAGDSTVNPSWCGGAGGTAAQHIAWVNSQKSTLRASLPR